MAVGVLDLDSTPFCRASVFNFQQRLEMHQQETGINLLETVFDQLTDKQLKTLRLKTDIQRMDSTQAASNIRDYSRLELLVEVLHRLFRVLSEADRTTLMPEIDPYLKADATDFIYHLKPADVARHQIELARLYHWLHESLQARYADEPVFAIFSRVYREHFRVENEAPVLIPAPEITTPTLQSPDDPYATYRTKRDKASRGFAINITETTNPDNPIQLITDVATERNAVDDSTFLLERIERIKAKTPDLKEIHTDAAYGSSAGDQLLKTLEVTHIQTAIKGQTARVPIRIEPDESTTYMVSCPHQTVSAAPTRTQFKAEFDPAICEE